MARSVRAGEAEGLEGSGFVSKGKVSGEKGEDEGVGEGTPDPGRTQRRPNKAGGGRGLTSKLISPKPACSRKAGPHGDMPQVGAELPTVSFSFLGTWVHLPTENDLGARKPVLPD